MSNHNLPLTPKNECEGCAARDRIIRDLAQHIDLRNKADEARMNSSVVVPMRFTPRSAESFNQRKPEARDAQRDK